MQLFLIRHGQSEHNAARTELKDSRLTPLGELQARRAGEALRNEGIQRVFCSAQIRGLQTAALIDSSLNVGIEAIPNLSERNLCMDEPGYPRSVLTELFPTAALPVEVDEEGWARHWTNGESFEELAQRMGGVAEVILNWAANRTYEKIAIVIHHGSGSMLLRKLFQIPDSSPAFFTHMNCAISQLAFGDRVRLLKLNDGRHLEGLKEDSLEENAAVS